MAFIAIPLPPLAEQDRIVAKVQQIKQQLNKLESKVQKSRRYTEQLLQSVLKEAFAGKSEMRAESLELTIAVEEEP